MISAREKRYCILCENIEIYCKKECYKTYRIAFCRNCIGFITLFSRYYHRSFQRNTWSFFQCSLPNPSRQLTLTSILTLHFSGFSLLTVFLDILLQEDTKATHCFTTWFTSSFWTPWTGHCLSATVICAPMCSPMHCPLFCFFARSQTKTRSKTRPLQMINSRIHKCPCTTTYNGTHTNTNCSSGSLIKGFYNFFFAFFASVYKDLLA